MRKFVCCVFALMTIVGCSDENPSTDGEKKEMRTLPYLGNHDISYSTVNGEMVEDTIYHTIPDWQFIDQNGDTITHETLEGEVYVADFFFTKCPSMCPQMTNQLKRFQKMTEGLDVTIVSHTIDPERDSSETFKQYIEKFGINDHNWYFLTAPRSYVELIGKDYIVTAGYESDDPSSGGFLHSSKFVLVDQNRHIRGLYDGMETEEVDQLVEDVKLLLADGGSGKD